jgi:HAMP domain-containing protein
MKLLPRFTMIFALVFGAGMSVAGVLAWRFLDDNARDQVIGQARLMMQSALAMRAYTNRNIKPLLDTPEMRRHRFFPETVPSFAATENFSALHKQYPSYFYKEATLNPTNLRDRAVDWETDVINTLRNDPARTEVIGERDTPDGKSLFLARPISAPPPCLECHSVPSAAPPSMIRIYGRDHGFGWKPNEIVGAQIVSVPESVPFAMARRAFGDLFLYLGGVALATLILIDVALHFFVVKPVARLSATADEISRGNLEVSELPVRGRDEISLLASSFNRMYVSLKKALRLLEE